MAFGVVIPSGGCNWKVSKFLHFRTGSKKMCDFIESYFTNDSKLEKNVKGLAGAEWFDELASDFRYSHIIWNNNWVVRYLSEDSNVELLKKDKEEQRKFIEMVKQEHRKFAGISSKESR